MISLGVDTSHNDDNTEQKTNGNVMCTILFHFHIYDHQENISQVILFFSILFVHALGNIIIMHFVLWFTL